MIRLLLALMLLASPAMAQIITPGAPVADAMTLSGPKTSGRAFMAGAGQTISAVALANANRLYAMPLWIGNASLAKTLSFDITVGNASAWNARMCLYQDNGAGLPGALYTGADSGTIAIASGSVTGIQTSSTLNTSGVVVQGWVWVAFMASATGETLDQINNAPAFSYQILGSTIANAFTVNYTNGVYAAQTFGACPSTFPTPSYLTAGAEPAIAVGF